MNCRSQLMEVVFQLQEAASASQREGHTGKRTTCDGRGPSNRWSLDKALKAKKAQLWKMRAKTWAQLVLSPANRLAGPFLQSQVVLFPACPSGLHWCLLVAGVKCSLFSVANVLLELIARQLIARRGVLVLVRLPLGSLLHCCPAVIEFITLRIDAGQWHPPRASDQAEKPWRP